MSILMVPIVYVFRFGSNAALSGLVKTEITSEARLILRPLKADLKYSVFFLDYAYPPFTDPQDYFQLLLRGNGETVYVLYRFPLHGSLEDFIESGPTGTAYRVPVRITYEVKKEGGSFYSLYRTEGNGSAVCLSKRVNFFEIEANSFAPPQTSWIVSLQLADIVKNLSTDFNVQKGQNAQNQSVKALDRKLTERTQGIQLADYFQVVGSEYFAAFRTSTFLPNWHTLFRAFLGKPVAVGLNISAALLASIANKTRCCQGNNPFFRNEISAGDNRWHFPSRTRMHGVRPLSSQDRQGKFDGNREEKENRFGAKYPPCRGAC
jgi:hypothetical protein